MLLSVLALGLLACSGGDPEVQDSPANQASAGSAGASAGGAAGSPDQTPAGEGGEGGQPPQPPGPGRLLGHSDGETSADLVLIHEPKSAREATDLGFHPERPTELWVIYRWKPTEKDCTEKVPDGCTALEGSVALITDPGTESAKVVIRKDPNAWHFMRRPSSFAFGAPETMATCGEARTGNFLDDETDYTGPVLFSTDPAVFAVQPEGEDKNGSHLDMLHATPWCMGIAHEKENVYWAFNGDVGAIDRNDFKADHGPGNHYHSDGEVLRYGKGKFKRVPNVPSHLKFSASDRMLYVADTGNKRVARLDTASGTPGGNFTPNYDSLPVARLVNGVDITDPA